MPRPRRAWAARLLLIAFGLALGLGAAELALRWGGPRWLGYRMRELTAGTPETFGTDAGFPLELRNDIVIGYRPGSRFPVTHYEYVTTAAIDAWGGRMTAAAGASCDRVVPFLGDSVTFGVGVEDHETFVSLLRARATGCYLNIGIPATALAHQLDIVELRHDELGRPPVYVFNVCVENDFSDLITYERARASGGRQVPGRPPPAATGALDEHSWVARINTAAHFNPLLRRSFLVQYARQQVLSIYNTRRSIPIMFPVFFLFTGNEEYVTQARAALGRSVARLAALARQRRFSPIVVIIPDVHQVEQDRRAARAEYYGLEPSALDITRPNRMLAEELDAAGIERVDLLSCLQDRKGAYYVNDYHLTAAGHRIVADCLTPRLNSRIEELAR